MFGERKQVDVEKKETEWCRRSNKGYAATLLYEEAGMVPWLFQNMWKPSGIETPGLPLKKCFHYLQVTHYTITHTFHSPSMCEGY